MTQATRGSARRAGGSALRRDFLRSVGRSKGRFVSIVLLMALGSFALVGLFVAGPDMRSTARAYFDGHDLADVTVISDFGLDADDVTAIGQASGVREVEYGYFKDVTIDGTTTGVRVMSATDELSQFELVDGRMPEAAGEIALDSDLAEDYPLGETIRVDEKADSVSGSTVLSEAEFTVVGHVNSSEIVSTVNMGQSTAGTGSLAGYAVVTQSAFDSDVYMLARLAFDDTEGMDPYSDAYRDAVQAHKDELEELLADRPAARLATVRSQYQEQIDSGQAEVDDARSALDDAAAQLDDAAAQIADAERQIADARSALDSGVADGQAELDASWALLEVSASQLTDACARLEAAAAQIADGEAQLAAAREQLASGQAEFDAAEAQLAEARATLDRMQTEYDDAAAEFASAEAAYEQQWPAVSAQWEASSATWAELDAQRDAIAQAIETYQAMVDADPTDEDAAAMLAHYQGLSQSLAQLDELKAGYDQLASFAEGRDELQAQLDASRAQLDAGWAEYDAGMGELAEKGDALEASGAALSERSAQLDSARASYDAGRESYNEGVDAYNEGLDAYWAGAAELESSRADGEAQIADAEDELAERRGEYLDALDEYESALPDAEEEIADAETELAEARERMEGLATPSYDVDSRRETPGSDAYVTYDTISEIVDSLALVFPVFLYLVAALVTLTTMTRMVDEERVNSGTLKALGYSDAAIARKFVAYGAISGGAGALVGIALGHTLLPWIVYLAYGGSFTLPPIQLSFYPGITVVALVLAGLCSVLPAWLAVKRELSERPAQLLLPKPPRSGSKIFLERVRPLWNRLSFTHKVTARNLFRYKQRMLMTVVGVAGAVCMLVTGFGVRASIQEMGGRQFGEIIRYDMIVADASSATDAEVDEVEALLADEAVVESSLPVHYESASKVAGEAGDRQDITLIACEDAEGLDRYVGLAERASGERIELGESGAVISERLSSLTGAGVGDELTFEDAEGVERSVTVTGVTEMYMGHFVFLSADAYEDAFGKSFSPNASLVILDDGSTEGVERAATRFMELPGVAGVVQNTALEDQVNTIVDSLDMIMEVLILVSSMLALVIMYNLTNLNVSERMRELSTIKVLGFHTNETTMYIYRETVILTALGLLAGFCLGVGLHEYILWVVPPDNVMFNPGLSAIEFIVPTAVICAITLVLYFVVLHRLRHVDMLEALKSVD